MKSPYVPKPIRGQSFPGHTKVSLAQVKRLFADGQSFSGFIVGNKVHSLADFEKHLNSFHYYLDPELGDRAAIFLKKRKASKASAFVPSLPLLIG